MRELQTQFTVSERRACDPNYLIEGFDLAGAEGNPFTAFRFPEVPAGSDNRFTLRAGSSVISGLAGQTVDLRQFAPAGLPALSVRGNFWSFHPVPGTDNPLGGVPLAYGAAFAHAGIAQFTLKPVPEPSTGLLMVVGLAVAVGHRKLRNQFAV